MERKEEKAQDSKETRKNTSGSKKTIETKKQNNPSTTENKVSGGIGGKVVTAKVFAGMIGVNAATKFWVSKRYSGGDKRTMNDWSKEFIIQGAIHKTPAILA